MDLAAHLLHLSPRVLPWQRVLDSRLKAEPVPTHRADSVDHFGNPTTRLFLDSPHARFEVAAEAMVDVQFPPPPPPEDTPAWDKLAAALRAGEAAQAEAAEFLFPSPMLPPSPQAADYAVPCFPPGRPVMAGVRDLCARIRREFSFRTGVTTVTTGVAQVLAQRSGVCQDFTHLMVAALRGLGLPARYVSGYIRTRPPPGQVARRGVDQSHAWVSCWLGPQHGWVDLDPTNDLVVSDEHVVLAWGRDFGDVSPLGGVILGGGAHTLWVGVDMEALG